MEWENMVLFQNKIHGMGKPLDLGQMPIPDAIQ
jgi:hypothetical protein